MKISPLNRLSGNYLAALRAECEQASQAGPRAAHKVDRAAVAAGLETLDLARIHHQALTQLLLEDVSAVTREEMTARAAAFFTESITPLDNQVVKTLSQRTIELANSVAKLKQEIRQRKVVEESLRASELTSISLLEKSQQMQEELRHLSRQLLSVQEEERRKISRELHDVIAQTLTSINVRLAGLTAESTTSSAQLRKQIASTQRLVEKSVDIVHRFARELRPTLLDDLGLIPALQSFLKGYMEDTGIRASLKVFAGIEDTSDTLRTMLYRVALEALTNVARHAKASRVEVSIESLDGSILMEITDNGQGFEVNGKASAKKHNRLGLLGMRERVEMHGGTFAVVSAPGHATTVRVDTPRQRPGRRKC
ncbi:MAG: sensor histidine kinase [Verrucomicrobiota bacterium]